MAVKTTQEIWDAFILELQTQKPELTDTSEGSVNDVLAGATATAVNELCRVVVDEFRKTFIDTSNGPEITGGPDELQTLAVDHYGDQFARPQAINATGTVTFSRATTGAGNVTISAGTIVKTPPSASGQSQRFEVTGTVTLTGLTISASVRAVVAGPDGNVQADTVTVIETSLTDSSVTVNNAGAFAGGKNAQTDSEYRETIRNLLLSLRSSTAAAIEAKAKTVGGVVSAKLVENQIAVKEWDIGGGAPTGDYFLIPKADLYIADANGTASDDLISDVQDAIANVRATGVRIEVLAGSALTQNWTVSIVLNPSGPNFPTLSTDTTMITDVMREFIQNMLIGDDFIRTDARQYVLDQFPSDLVDLAISIPSGDVSVASNEKMIPGVMAVV